MPRRTTLNFGDFEAWIANITSELGEQAAEATIKQLQIKGPYWTGAFAGAWEARVGDVEIPADQTTRSGKKQPRQLETYSVQKAPRNPGQKLTYSIDNAMEYRDIAKDLVPTVRGFKPSR